MAETENDGEQEEVAFNRGPDIWHRVDLAMVEYREALDLQHRIVAARIKGTLACNVLLFLEHPPVFTLGRRGGREHLTVSESFLKESKVDLVQTERGGDITFHGPGQLVVYPVVDLQAGRIKVVDFVEGLEEVMIRAAARYRVKAGREALNRGVWVDRQKLGSVGICVRRGVSFHGLALNVNLALAPFGWIHPCGLEGICMTSLARELKREVPMEDVRNILAREFETVFGITNRPMKIDDLRGQLARET